MQTDNRSAFCFSRTICWDTALSSYAFARLYFQPIPCLPHEIQMLRSLGQENIPGKEALANQVHLLQTRANQLSEHFFKNFFGKG